MSLLVLAVLALAIGWITDRQFYERRYQQKLEAILAHQQQELERIRIGHQQELEDTFVGSYRFQEAWEAILAAQDLLDATPAQIKERIDHGLFWSMRIVWRYERQIDKTIDDESYSAVVLARQVLQLLECQNAKAYFRFATNLMPDEGDGLFPEIHNRQSTEHQSFEEFIGRAFASGSDSNDQ